MSARPKRPKKGRANARPEAALLESSDASLLELVDHVLNKGVVVQGEVMLGVAGVDLIYLRLQAVLCTVDRMFPHLNAGKRARR